MGRPVVGLLAVAALVQIVAPQLVRNHGVAEPEVNPFEAELGALGLKPGESGLVVVAFHPECVHCDVVAPHWAAWFEDLAVRGWEVLAATLSSTPEGTAYARSAGWEAEVVSASDEPRIRPLASRTPWIFVYASDGSLTYHGHGGKTDQADRVIRALVSGSDSDE